MSTPHAPKAVLEQQPEQMTAASMAASIGARLRSIREQKRWSLSDVDRLSDGHFGPSTVGAYERGERAITVPRLDRLAGFYGVSIDQFLPAPAGQQPVATRRSPIDERLTIDIAMLRRLDGTGFATLMRFVELIRAQRLDHHGDIITLRGADAVVASAMLGVPVESVVTRLRALDLLSSDPVADA
jgi:transcriptional regulator with XRE-family HTH domain